MKRLLIILAIALFALPVSAQQRSKITATVVDVKSGNGVPGAVVELAPTAKPDNKKYYTTGYGGKVEIANVAFGNYKLTITFLGYEDFVKEFKVSTAALDLGTLQISESATRIDTVVKEAKALRTSQDGDTLSYNAGAFKVTGDADVEGLLKKMPGITIQNGEVSAQGETVKKVYVDGKEFFGEDVNTAIKSLPAQAVDRIEVYNKLSDQAEFSGMDDGEGFKALNIVTHRHMRQGQFGKMYAGYGYQPKTDDITSHHKYTVGGNINIFNKDSRLSVLGLFNNINQQNFSFEDILGVAGSGGGGGRRRGVGQYMVAPQAGVALVNSVGLNFSDQWGKKDQVKFQGSYFFNNTDTKNLSEQETWYEVPSPIDTLLKSSRTRSLNNNHRLNARLDWKISDRQSLMSRTNFSYQGNVNPKDGNLSEGYKYGQSGLTYIYDKTKRNSHGFNFSEFLQYRLRIGEKKGRTLSISGRFSLRDNYSLRRVSSNNADPIVYDSEDYNNYMEQYRADGAIADIQAISALYNPLCQFVEAPSRTYNAGGTLEYNEPLGKTTALSFQYRFSYEDESKEQEAYYTDNKFNIETGTVNKDMTQDYRSGYWTHRVGPGFRYSQKKNTFVANVYYQYSSLDGNIVGAAQSDKIKKDYHNVLYFAMLNYMFNKENSIRLFFRSYTDNPSVTQLQSIYDVSTPQYLSIGNKDLNPSFTHRINFHYINSNVEKGRTFMWMFMMQNQQNAHAQSTFYNRNGVTSIDVNGTTYRPQQVTSYENMDGYWNLRTHLSLGLPLSFMKCNLNLMAGVNYIVNPSAVYSTWDDVLNHKFTTNYANNIGYDAQVTLGSNISEKIDFTVSWNGAFNQAWNTAAGKNEAGKYQMNNYFNHSVNGSLKWIFWKGFTFTAACSYVQYLGFTNDYKEDYVLCNLYLGKKIFRNQLGEIQIGVNDVANQNTAFVRSTGSGYTQNLTNSVIGRYFSVQFVYNLRRFGKKGSTNMKDYDYNESRSGVGVNGHTGGMRPMGPPPGVMRR